MSKRKKYLFGPVPSRRLGTSLGIDLLPYKTCTLDCIYCECGETTALTLCRKEYVPPDEVLAELDEVLRKKPALDYVTFAGSGEPLLHSGISLIINWLKKHYPHYAVAVLTNGTLLSHKEVRAELKEADLVIPSLDAVTEANFQMINRPYEGLSCEGLVSGLVQFRREYDGEICLEVFIIPGLNDDSSELKKMREIIHLVSPDRVQLNTLDRLGTEEWVRPASEAELRKCAAALGRGEVVAGYRPRRRTSLLNDMNNKC